MDKETMAELANSVNDVVAATSKPLNLQIVKLKAENKSLKYAIKLEKERCRKEQAENTLQRNALTWIVEEAGSQCYNQSEILKVAEQALFSKEIKKG